MCAGALVLIHALGGCCPQAWYEVLAPNPEVRVTVDEAPHCYGGEWWYYTGRVTTDDGAGYGIEAVIFHAPHLPVFALWQGWVAHFAVLDEAEGSFVYDQFTFLSPASPVAMARDGFKLFTPLVQMTGGEGRDHLRAAMIDDSYVIDLHLEDERGPVLHGDVGYVPFTAGRSSFYYSRPRMRATGTLAIDGRDHLVNGYLWFDRQWGRDLNNPWLAWDWFSLRLDDGTDVMLFLFRDGASPGSVGTYIPATGEPYGLGEDDIVVTALSYWTSPHTGATYPVAWDIQVLPEELELSVVAVLDDQEFDARATTFNVYWEGLCTVRGTHRGRPTEGWAYVELTNYAR